MPDPEATLVMLKALRATRLDGLSVVPLESEQPGRPRPTAGGDGPRASAPGREEEGGRGKGETPEPRPSADAHERLHGPGRVHGLRRPQLRPGPCQAQQRGAARQRVPARCQALESR